MPSSLNVALQNQTSSSTVYAYITGLALNNNNAVFLLQADGKSYYYPSSPSSTGTPLAQNCAIALGNPGNTVTVTIPLIAGGRIWFSVGAPLTFLLNPGPALVEPSVTNPTDPNINVTWGFCEFTLNSAQLYANISYVDFVCLPISLALTNASGATQKVTGMPANGLATVCAGLRAQTAADGQGWSSLIVQHNGQDLRALSPNQGMVMNPSLLSNYFDPYVNQVWSRLSSTPLSVDTQASFGRVSGQVSNNTLNFGNLDFARPSTHDIWTCSTGPFATGPDAQTNTIIPRLAAAFNRSTLLTSNLSPAPQTQYYQNPITNHYSRIVHGANLDGRGYAFPYDDVQPDGGADQSGAVFDPNPTLLTVAVGGGAAESLRRHKAAAPPVAAAAGAAAQRVMNGGGPGKQEPAPQKAKKSFFQRLFKN